MSSAQYPVKVGIVGLGRWAKVLTRAASKSAKISIVAGYSRSEEKRTAFQQETGVPPVADMQAMLADAALIRLSEITDSPQLLTTDSDFHIYRRHGRQIIPLISP
jgi:AraC-like DNA-binding protein